LGVIAQDEVKEQFVVGDMALCQLTDGRAILALWTEVPIEAGTSKITKQLIAGLRVLRDQCGKNSAVGGDLAITGEGGAAATKASVETVKDPRICDITTDSRSKRYVDFKVGCDRLSEPKYDDWPVEGPNTLVWLMLFLSEFYGTPISFFNKFTSDGRLTAADPGIVTLEVLCRVLQAAVNYDQLNVGHLASLELVARFFQMIVMRYRERVMGGPAKGGKDGATAGGGKFDEDLYLYLGTSVTRGRLPIAPALTEWMSTRQKEEALVYKEKRKLNEERKLLKDADKSGGTSI
jgi:hypothetical protein